MNFNMVAPCAECPFRSDRKAYLTRARVRQLIGDITTGQKTFACHKTVYSNAEDEHCAGALIFLERMDKPNQMMRWMERLGGYDRTKLKMDSPIFEDAQSMIEAQK